MASNKKPRKAYQPKPKESELQGIYRDCKSLLTQYNPESLDGAGDPALQKKAEELKAAHLKHGEALEKIYAENEPYHREPRQDKQGKYILLDGKRTYLDPMEEIQIGERYFQWADSYADTVAPLALEVNELADQLLNLPKTNAPE